MLRLFYLMTAPSLTQLVAGAEYANLGVPYLYTTNPITPLPQGTPWGSRTANGTSPGRSTDDIPRTGVIRKYDFSIGRKEIAPDGYTKNSLVINGQFPGPLIEANWGDTIQVTAKNDIVDPEEGTSIHWHGLLQKDSPWMDGVPAVTQCPIAPGESFTYSFIADSYGSSWYHSHYSAQYADGVFGPIVIHGPTAAGYDIDIGPVLVTDYYHLNYTTINERAFSSNFSVVTVPGVNSLINGRNNYNCSLVDEGDTSPCVSNAGVSTFQFTAGKKHRLRFVNAGASALQTVSIDGHNLTVIANDFVPVVPYQTQYIKLGVGQRTDVIVEGLTDATGSYFLRSQSPAKPCADTIQPNATAIIYYQNEYLPEPDPWPAFTDAVEVCANDPLESTVPLYPIASPSNPGTTWDLNITLAQNETGSYLWYMNNVTFRGDYNHPILLLSNLGNNSYPDPEWNVENFRSNSSIRMVVNNANPRTHPMHLHGHNYLVEAVGNGTWDGIITRPDNPQRRDTQLVPGNGYMVISFTADNPGAWPFHCHVAWHVAAGLYITVLERPDDIANYKIPSTVAHTCRNWWAYTNTTVVDQIDSGL